MGGGTACCRYFQPVEPDLSRSSFSQSHGPTGHAGGWASGREGRRTLCWTGAGAPGGWGCCAPYIHSLVSCVCWGLWSCRTPAWGPQARAERMSRAPTSAPRRAPRGAELTPAHGLPAGQRGGVSVETAFDGRVGAECCPWC